MDYKPRVQKIVDAMSRGQVAPLFDAMAEDVTWRWMGVSQWSKAFDGKQIIIEKLFRGGVRDAKSVVQSRGPVHSRRR